MSDYTDLNHNEMPNGDQTQDPKQTTEIENQIDVQKLSNINKEIEDHDEEEEEIGNDELIYDNEIFGEISKKIKIFVDKSKEEQFGKDIFIDEYQILNDLFTLIEKHEKHLIDEDLLAIKNGFELFISAGKNIYPHNIFTNDLNSEKKEIFYMFFYLINHGLIQKQLKNQLILNELKTLVRTCTLRIFNIIFKAGQYTNLSLNDPQRPANCIELLALLLNFVKININSSDLTRKSSIPDGSMLRHYILRIIWSYSDKPIFIPDLIEAGAAEIMINGLTLICKTSKVRYNIREQFISIINNISRHDDGIKKLNSLNATAVIKQFESQNSDSLLNTKSCMALALLATPERIKKNRKRMDNVLDTLLRKVYHASLSSNSRDGGCHLSEPLLVFVKLFHDDRTLDYVMEHSKVDLHTSTVDFFVNLFINYYTTTNNNDPLKQGTCATLVNILWSISFQQKYKEKLKNVNPKFIQLLNNLTKETDENIPSDQYVPQYIENIHKAAKGLLYNIDELADSVIVQVVEISTYLCHDQRPLIMISYSHGDTDFCKHLLNEIEKRGYGVWIDFKYLKTGDLWEQIAAGMKHAAVIVCLMSEEYCKSKSCRWEATFALDKLLTTKPVIPVLLRKHELPDWLDIRIAMLKYIRFDNLEELCQIKLLELIDAIEDSLPRPAARNDFNLFPSQASRQYELATSYLRKLNEVQPCSSDSFPINNDELAQSKPTITNTENPSIAAQHFFSLRTITDPYLHPEKPVDQWNQNDISRWFQHHNILTELRDLCQFNDGGELLLYTKLFLDTEKQQYQMYSEEFLRRDGITGGQKPLLLHEFTKFANALRKLEKLHKSSSPHRRQ